MNTTSEGKFELPTVMPSTVAYIGYHAAQRPDDVAVIENEKEITYNQFYRDIGQMVAAVRRFGLRPGHVVAIEYPYIYLHWLTMLAVEALGAASFSYEEPEVAVLGGKLAEADFVFCSPSKEPANAKRTQAMDEDWIAWVNNLTPEYPVQTAPIGSHTPSRIVKSSGTTGALKRMIHTGRVREFWISQYQFRTGFNRHSRYLRVMGFSVEAYHVYVTACIRMGGTCVVDDRSGVAEALARHAITHVTFPPFLLMQVLGEIPENYVKAPNLTIFTIGAPVSKDVRTRVERVLGSALVESYGTQEIAAICTMAEDGVGTVLPGVTVEVVDDDDQPILDTPGRVRIKSDGSITNYLDDPEATRRMFHNGWFYPGDLAVMTDKHIIRLLGRADDVLNIQGSKFAPGPLEENFRGSLPVEDLCLTAIADDDGVERLCIVVVVRTMRDFSIIKEKLTPKVPPSFGKVYFVAIRTIPRTITGKVRRKELNQAILQAQRRAQQ